MSRPEPKSWSSGLLWDRLAEQDRKELLERINPIDGRRQVDTNTAMENTRLPFYSDHIKLLRLSDPKWSARLYVYYLQNKENLYRLNGTSPPIHEVNAKAPIQLNESNVLAYLRFFCFFVRGDYGPFLIFESLDQPEIPDISSAEEHAELEKHAYPARFNGVDAEGKFLAAAMIWYGNAVFAAKFKIQPTGMVEMDGDEPVLGDLTTKIEAPLS